MKLPITLFLAKEVRKGEFNFFLSYLQHLLSLLYFLYPFVETQLINPFIPFTLRKIRLQPNKELIFYHNSS
jgi:hypothetical protein